MKPDEPAEERHEEEDAGNPSGPSWSCSPEREPANIAAVDEKRRDDRRFVEARKTTENVTLLRKV